jgi:hypothetical protein
LHSSPRTKQARITEIGLMSSWVWFSNIETNWLTIAWNSPRSFCIGVPDNMTLLRVSNALNTAAVLLFADFNRCPDNTNLFAKQKRYRFWYLPSSHMINPIGGLRASWILRHIVIQTWTYYMFESLSLRAIIKWPHGWEQATHITVLRRSYPIIRTSWTLLTDSESRMIQGTG